MDRTGHRATTTKKIARALGFVIWLAGSAVLIGWCLDIGILKSVLPGLVTMKPNTALGFFFIGLTLMQTVHEPTSNVDRWLHKTQDVWPVFTFLIGAATLVEYVWNVDLRIDQWLFIDTVPSPHPGRMAHLTALNFFLIGATHFMRDRVPYSALQALQLFVILIATLALVGYLYSVEALYEIHVYSPMALHTAVLFFLSGVGFLLHRPTQGLIALVLRDDSGGLMARRLSPTALCLPLFLGWLRLQGQLRGWYGSEFGLALLVVANAVVFFVLVMFTSSAVSRMDAHRLQVEHDLYLNAARFQALVQSISTHAILLLDIDGNIQNWGAGAQAIKGYRADEIIGKNFSCFYTAEDQATGHPKALLHLAEKDGRAQEEGWRVRKDGSCFFADIVIVPLREESGALNGFAKITKDITEQKRLQAEVLERNRLLAEQTVALEQSNIELQQFAYIASHDLQTPIRSISGLLKLIETRYAGKLDAEADDWMRRAIGASEQMHALIRDVLNFAKIDSRLQSFVPVDMNTLLDEVIVHLAALIQEQDGRVTHDPLPLIDGDRSQLLELMQNLIGNSLKYYQSNPADDENHGPRVHVSVQRKNGEWLFAVRDNGIGIAPKHQERIFEIFRRLHDQSAYPGTGIGLAICRRVVQHHGGNIWVESGPDSGLEQGSIFYFTIKQTEN